MAAFSILRRKTGQSSSARSPTLSANLSFLDVILAACQHSGRYTLVAESGGVAYIVMIDRGGPFNATGGGLTGSAALAIAASLRDGSYSVTEGWPVEQPLYQLGLDAALQSLSLGARAEIQKLPPARGVDAIRNDAWSTAATSVASSAAPLPKTPWMPEHAALEATDAQAAGIDRSEAPARPAENAATVPEYGVDQSARWLRAAASGTTMDLDAAAPADPGTSPRQGPVKHAITQLLLWMVQVEDETDRYSLGQALTLVGRALGSAFAFFGAPVEREVFSRWHQVRDDWRLSGEATKNDKHRPRRKPAARGPR